MKWPSDRKFTDRDGKILDHWRGPMSVLEPLLNLTPAQFAALQQIIAAFLEQDDEEADPGTAINLALPIDGEPLPSEDWLISYKNAAQAGRRVAMSRFAAPQVISSTSLSGSADVIISVPSGYTDFELRVKGLSTSANTIPTLQYSEDGGGTFVNQPGAVMTRTSITSNVTTLPGMLPANMAAADIMYAVEKVRDYASLTTKLAILEGSYSSEFIYRGVNIQSTQRINAAQFSVPTGTFDGGNVDLICIP